MLRPDPHRLLLALLLAAALPACGQHPVQSAGQPAAAATAPAAQAPAAQAPAAQQLSPNQPARAGQAGNPGQPNAQAVQPTVQHTPEELADSLEVRQRYQEAIEEYRKVEHPTAAVWNKMGISYQMMFNLKEATRCYKESLRLDPHNATVYNNLGTVYDSLKDYKAAERMYHKALKVDPKSALILKNLGTNLMVQRKFSKGWRAYDEATTIDPTIFEDRGSPQVQNPTSIRERGAMNYYMALGCVRSGQTDCALQYLRMALNEGFVTAKKIAADEDFFVLRKNPAFQQLLAEQQVQKQTQHP